MLPLVIDGEFTRRSQQTHFCKVLHKLVSFKCSFWVIVWPCFFLGSGWCVFLISLRSCQGGKANACIQNVAFTHHIPTGHLCHGDVQLYQKHPQVDVFL